MFPKRGIIMIKTDGYPLPLSFPIIERSLPPFEYGCPFRTGILRDHLKSKKYNTLHDIDDFVVEKVEKTVYGEFWYIGS